MSDPVPPTGVKAAPAAESRASPADAIDSPRAGRAALRGSVVRGGGYAVSVLLSLIAVPLLIRHLGVADFGRYATVISLVALVGSLVDAGLNGIAIREWATTSGAERNAGMRNLLGIRIVFTALGGIGATLFALVAGYDEALVTGTILVASAFVLQATTSFLTVPLQGDLRFGWVALIDLARQALTVPLIVLLVVLGAGLLPFFVVPLPAAAITLVATAVLVRGQVPLRPSFHFRGWSSQLRATLVYSVAIALSAVYLRITIIIMSLISSSDQTGYFATSFRVVEVLIAVPMLVIGAAFPILARSEREDRERFRRAAERIYELALIAGTMIALALVLAAPFVIDVIGGADAEPATGVLQIQGATLIGTFVATAGNYVLLSLHRHRALLLANLIALVASIALSFALVPLDGARGGAIATVGAESLLAVVVSLLVVRAGAGVRLPLRALPVVVLAAAAGAALLLVPDLHPLLAAAGGCAAFVLALAACRRLPPELPELVRTRRQL